MKLIAVKTLVMVQEMERAISFYTDVLGLDLVSQSDTWSELRFGDAIVALHGGGKGQPVETGLSFQYDDVYARYDLALRSGAAGIKAPERRPGEPIVLAQVQDPEGNIIMLTSYVG